MKAIPRIAALLLLSLVAVAPLAAAPDNAASAQGTVEYKLIADFKKPFNDALQYHLSNGWVPVGGVSVTVYNSDFYFAQLISKTK